MDSRLRVGEPQCIAPTGDKCGEGILWDEATQSVYWTDINRFLVHRYSWKSAEVRTWLFQEPVTCVLAASCKQVLALILGSGAMFWEPERDLRHDRIFQLPNWPTVRCNDAGVDPRGALWVGSMRNNVKEDGESIDAGGWDGVLYRIDGEGAITVMESDVGISNTVLWNPDHSKFYFGDSMKNEIRSYDYDASDGSIDGERSFFKGFERGLPDGSAVDNDGYIWNCRYGGSCVVRVSPDGLVDRVIELPVSYPTNCTFGGEDNNILLVTSASPESGKWERFGGGLFAIRTNTTGQLPNELNWVGGQHSGTALLD